MCSFLKKRTKRLLILRKRTNTGLGRRGGSGARHKGLLVPAGRALPFLQKATAFLGKSGEPYCGMSAARPQARHDQQTVIVRRADFGSTIGCDQRVARGHHIAAPKILHEAEAAGRSGDRHGDLGEPRLCARCGTVQPGQAGGGEQAADRRLHRVDGADLPVLASFDEYRGGAGIRTRLRIDKRGVVNQAAAAGVAVVRNNQRRRADPHRQAASLLGGAA